jgi:ABC-type cobalamin/Fe3+-siderophores transport system ATPase subunit
MTPSILSVRDVGWRVGGAAILRHVGFDVAPGEFVGIMGRNGAGKSTLLDIISGLRSPTSGDVFLADRPLRHWSSTERARFLAHLPQSIRGDLAIRAEALVLMGRYVHAMAWFESIADREIAAEAMRRCDCFQFRDRLVSTLSGGERQRVFLAACLAQQPRLLLLDEPATFLDLDQQLECFTLLREEANRSTACLAVTHDVNLALTFCTRVIVLADGAVAYDLQAASALDSPEWLRAISQRLGLHTGSQGRVWVGYQ